MTVHRLSCASCGANLTIPGDVTQLSCTYCGASQVVQRGEGYVALKLAETVARSIEEGTAVTRAELRRLQWSQERSAAQMQLSGIQAEMRALARAQPDRAVGQQLAHLRDEESALRRRIGQLTAALGQDATDQASGPTPAAFSGSMPRWTGAGKDRTVTLVLCLVLGVLGAHRFYTGHITIGIIQALTGGGFGIWWLVDLVLIATGHFRDASGRLLRGHERQRGCLLGGGVFIALALVCSGLAGAVERVIWGGSAPTEGGPLTALAIATALIVGIGVVVLVENPHLWRSLADRLRRS